MISLAKRGDLHARRQAEAFIMDKAVTKNCLMKPQRNIQNATAATPAY